MKETQSLANGTRIGPYVIDSLLGKGGMGEVYVAHEERLNRKVALKIIAIAGGPNDKRGGAKQEALRRFILEAKTLAKINHPNVVTIHAIEEIDDRQVIAMEFVEGPTLRQVLDSYAFAANEAASLFLQMLEGLRSLHENRVLHRDLKPQNMILRANGQMKILDFGIAKDADSDHEGTVAGAFVGTVNYLAPDVAAGASSSQRSDLWSMGAIFYEMLVGRKLIQPPDPDNFLAAIEYIKDLHVVFPAECEAWAPLEIQAIIAKLCANKAANRYVSAAEAIEDLRAFCATRPPIREKFYETVVRDVETALSLRRRMEGQGFSISAMKRIMAMSALKQFDLDEFPEVSVPLRGEMNDALRFENDVVSKSIVEFESGKLRIRANETSSFGTSVSRTFAPVPDYLANEASRLSESWSDSRANSTARAGVVRKYGPELLLAVGFLCLVFAGLFVYLKRAPTVSEDELRANQPHLVEPLQPSVAWLDPNQIATFKWLPAFEVGQYEIELSTDSKFEKITLHEGVYGTQFRPGRILPEGAYHWRLRNLKTQAIIGPAKFTLAYFGAPEPLNPPANARLETAPGQKGVDTDFAWGCRLGATQYRLQVTNDPGFSKMTVDRVVPPGKTECGFKAVSLAPGSYLWRVQVEEPGIANGRWSQPSRIDVSAPSNLLAVHAADALPPKPDAAALKPEAPKPEIAAAKSVLSLTNKISNLILQFSPSGKDMRAPASIANPPTLDWAAFPGAKNYELELSKSLEFSKPFLTVKTSASSFVWRQPLPGRYYWRVRAYGPTGILLVKSEVGDLRVSLPTPALKPQYKVVQTAVGHSGAGEPLDVRFQRVPLATHYLIQWSRDTSFKAMREVLSAVPGARLRLRAPGRYYVRVAAVDAVREPASAFSAPSIVDYSARPKAHAPAAKAAPKARLRK